MRIYQSLCAYIGKMSRTMSIPRVKLARKVANLLTQKRAYLGSAHAHPSPGRERPAPILGDGYARADPQVHDRRLARSGGAEDADLPVAIFIQPKYGERTGGNCDGATLGRSQA